MTPTEMLADPTLAALLANPDAPPGICADRLQELGAELAHVLILYAGTPPDYLDGLPQAVLVEWCKATEPNEVVSLMRPPDAIDALRWQVIHNHQGPIQWSDGHWRTYHPEPVHDYQHTHEATAIRYVKRRVLALFKDVVTWKRERRLSFREWDAQRYAPEVVNDILRANGFRFDLPIERTDFKRERQITYRQIILAPDLIPPEPLPLHRRDAMILVTRGEEGTYHETRPGERPDALARAGDVFSGERLVQVTRLIP